MAKDEKEALRNIINEYPDDIEAQIRLVEQSFNLPRGHAIAILENISESWLKNKQISSNLSQLN